MQAEAARTFADLIASTDFNPVDEAVEATGHVEALVRSAS
jgi:hypothetical protein